MRELPRERLCSSTWGQTMRPGRSGSTTATLAILFLGQAALSTAASEPRRQPSQPAWPNPYVSFLPAGAEPDMAYWNAFMHARAAERRQARAPVPTLMFGESEPNDTQAQAMFLTGFGTGAGEDGAADVTGGFTAQVAPTALGPFAEDEGSIPLASDTSLTPGAVVRLIGTIGDGPFGSSGTGSGDHDFFRIPGATLGELILIDIDTPLPLADLDTFIGLYDHTGASLALNEDEDGATNRDSFLAIPVSTPGDHYLSIAGSLFPFASILSDPFDSATGFGIGSEGDYEATVALDHGDADWYSFDLDACDILGINLMGGGRQVSLYSPTGELLVSSAQDLSAAYPDASPLPGGGRAALSYVAPTPGRYAVRAFGDGEPAYTLELRVHRQPGEAVAAAKTLFVDFDGATVDPAIFGFTPGSATLSPLASFLSNWGLGAGDENAVIDAVLASLEESLRADPGSQGPNPVFDVTILNSRDHADPFGAPNVSRLIVGGSVGELGIPTIGIAQSIDPGNFEAAETAVILLDLLSGPAIDPNSLNGFPLAPGAPILGLIGVALGNIAAHEAGHYLGSFHTEQSNSAATLMDRGGNLANTIGLGPDGIFGNADDVDVDFGPDIFEPSERFAGTQDTLTVVSCGCTTSAEVFSDGFEAGDLTRWSEAVP